MNSGNRVSAATDRRPTPTRFMNVTGPLYTRQDRRLRPIPLRAHRPNLARHLGASLAARPRPPGSFVRARRGRRKTYCAGMAVDGKILQRHDKPLAT
jgi:hypothetical protein